MLNPYIQVLGVIMNVTHTRAVGLRVTGSG